MAKKEKKKKIERVTKKIGLHIDDVNDAFSKYSFEDNYILDNDLIDYIERNATNKRDVTLLDYEIDFYCPKKLKEDEKNSIIEAYKKHYEQKIQYMHKQTKKSNRLAIGLFVAAAVVLAGRSITAELWKNAPYIIDFVLEIASWVFMWESVDMIFFTRNKELLDIAFYELLDDAHIVFIQEDKKKRLD